MDELVRACTLTDATKAEILRNALEDEGIDCMIDGENQAGLTGVLDIHLLVRADDLERARAFLEEHEKGGE